MKRTPLIAIAFGSILLGCGESREEDREVAPPAVAEEDSTAVADSLTMPDLPEARRGFLIARGAGPYELDGDWEAQTGACDEPPLLEVVGRTPGMGVLVLLQLPPAGERVTNYPVTIVEEGAPAAPASQIAVQLLEGSTGRAFQGLEGSIDVYRFDDRVSGQFAVTLREIASDDLQKYAGVFHEIPVAPLPEEQCAQFKAALEVPDSAATDTPRPQD